MDIDHRAREAVRAVQAPVGLDLDAGLLDLRARRRRGRVSRVLAVAAVLVLGLVLAELGQPDRTSEPVAPADDPVSTILYGLGDGSVGVGAVRSGRDLGPDRSIAVGAEPADMALSPGGRLLAVVDGTARLVLVDLSTGNTSTRSCARCTEVAWISDDEVVSRGSREFEVLRHDIAHGEPVRELSLPPRTPLSGVSPDGELVAFPRGVSDQHAQQVVLSRREGGSTWPLDATTTESGSSITEIDWSPDASHLGYVVASPVDDAIGGSDYALHVVRVDGAHPLRVTDLGRCVCAQHPPPSFAWSPDGTAVAAVVGDSAEDRDSFRLVTVDLEPLTSGGPVRPGSQPREVASHVASPVTWGMTAP